MDANPSISAGSKTSDGATVTKEIGWIGECASNWMNWLTQADLIMLREQNVSASNIYGYFVKQTTAVAGVARC